MQHQRERNNQEDQEQVNPERPLLTIYRIRTLSPPTTAKTGFWRPGVNFQLFVSNISKAVGALILNSVRPRFLRPHMVYKMIAYHWWWPCHPSIATNESRLFPLFWLSSCQALSWQHAPCLHVMPRHHSQCQ
jgi:hypothetical protein